MIDIIIKSLTGESSPQEDVLLNEWRSESQLHEQEYLDMKEIFSMTGEYEPVDFKPNAELAFQKHLALLEEEPVVEEEKPETITRSIAPEEKSTKVFTLRRISAVAAIAVILIAVTFLFDNFTTNTITSKQGIQYVSLDDGSSIWLDEGSTLKFKDGFGTDHRNIELDGKAYFKVNRNENLPFNISANEDLGVSVLGTEFTVDGISETPFVAVKSGKVKVSENGSTEILEQDEKVLVTEGKLSRETTSMEDFTWRNTQLSFDNSSIDQVIDDLNLFFGEKLTLKKDDKVQDCPLTAGNLKDMSFENIIKVLEVAYDIKAEQQENGKLQIHITNCK